MNGTHRNRIANTLAEVFHTGFKIRLVDLTIAAREYAKARATRSRISPKQQTRVINKLRSAAQELWKWDERYRDCPVEDLEVPMSARGLVTASLAFGEQQSDISDVAQAAVDFVKNQPQE